MTPNPMQFLFVFAQAHNEFRIPELKSIAKLYQIPLTLPDAERLDTTRPFTVVELEDEEHARMFARRCILIKSIYHLYGQGKSYEQLHVQVKANKHLWIQYQLDTSFKFSVTAYNHTIPQARQREIIESFSYMDFLGKIDMRHPEIVLGCLEEYEEPITVRKNQSKSHGDGNFRQVYLGRLVAGGTARSLITHFDVKKRVYYGNTSMDSEMSLLMANQTLAAPGSLIYDPFIGTGSMAYPITHFGAFVVGSDIDGRQMRGKERPAGILRAAAQYGVAHRIIDLCTFDVTSNPWRCGNLFDAITTDPPYGVRAGAKRLGRKKEVAAKQREAFVSYREEDQPYIPPTKPYELSDLASDLVRLARYLLKPGGRLVFFLPTVTDEYVDVDIHSMLCEGMEVIANSLQNFGSWGRRLVTIQKTTSEEYPPPKFDGSRHAIECGVSTGHVPAHKDFREKYFQGFRKDASS